MTASWLCVADKGIVAQQLSLRGSSLAEEMKQFSFYGRVCAMKGFLQALPKEVLCSKLHMLPAAAPSASPYPTSPSSCSALQQSNSSAPALSSLSVLAHPPQTDSTASPSTASMRKVHTAAVQASHMYKTDAQHVQAETNAADDFTLGKHQTFESKTEEPSEQGFAHVALPVSQDRASTTGTAGAAGTAHIAGAAGTAGSVWMLLSDGALPACCAAVQQSTDAHHKFHAVSALAFCLDRIKQCLQVCSTCLRLCLCLRLRLCLCLCLCLRLCLCLCLCLCLGLCLRLCLRLCLCLCLCLGLCLCLCLCLF